MAELIDKKDVINQIKSIPYATQEEVFFMSAAVSRIRKMPTTTEEEIRAKAIDEFAIYMCNEFDSKNADIENHTGSYVVSRLQKIAEQLKEE